VLSPVIWVKGTLPLPETNSHGKPTTKLNKLKNLKTLDLGVSLQGTTTFKKTKIKICGFGQPESLLERREFDSENGFFL
jgi:hypothetical protein